MKRIIIRKRIIWPSESAVRHRARKKGFKLRKCRRLDDGVIAFDTYQILAIGSDRVIFGGKEGMSIMDCDTIIAGWKCKPVRNRN
jgi:hypothetical protein